MGQKVNPHGLRVGVIKGWDSNWYADRRICGIRSLSGSSRPHRKRSVLLSLRHERKGTGSSTTPVSVVGSTRTGGLSGCSASCTFPRTVRWLGLR